MDFFISNLKNLQNNFNVTKKLRNLFLNGVYKSRVKLFIIYFIKFLKMEKKILTKADIKKYIIEYHDKVKSLIDIENQTELLYLENKLSKNYDKSKTEQSYIYNNLKEQIDEIKKNYLLQIEKVENVSNKNLELINISNISLINESTIQDILNEQENYVYCQFFPTNNLNERFQRIFPRGILIFCDWYLSHNEQMYLRLI